MNRRAWIVVGPTAAGKTDLAHRLARAWNTWILSADSMLVYRGMDLGTAKPTAQQRDEVHYEGIDLVDPDQSFTLHDYLAAVRSIPASRWQTPPIVVGGTGLYVKGLLQGLDESTPPDPAFRAAMQVILDEQGVEGLHAECRRHAPGLLESLADPANPRRVLRAMEQARSGESGSRTWTTRDTCPAVVGIDRNRESLIERILHRVDLMLDRGLIDEARSLRARFPVLSDTAAQAIGYREAYALLDATMDLSRAREEMLRRTRQLAKRQRTWFRHQIPVDWILPEASATEDENVRALEQRLQHHGHLPLHA